MSRFDPGKAFCDPPMIHPGWIVLASIFGGTNSLKVFRRFRWITGSQQRSTSGKITIHPTIHPDPLGWIVMGGFGVMVKVIRGWCLFTIHRSTYFPETFFSRVRGKLRGAGFAPGIAHPPYRPE